MLATQLPPTVCLNYIIFLSFIYKFFAQQYNYPGRKQNGCFYFLHIKRKETHVKLVELSSEFSLILAMHLC